MTKLTLALTKSQQVEGDLALISALRWWAKYLGKEDRKEAGPILLMAADRLAAKCDPTRLPHAGKVLKAVAKKVMDAVPGDQFRSSEFQGDNKAVLSAIHQLIRKGVLVRIGYGKYARFDG